MDNIQAHPSPPSFRKELQISVTPVLFFMTLLTVALLVFTSNTIQTSADPNLLLLRISLYLLIILVWIVRRVNETASKYLLVTATAALLFGFAIQSQYHDVLLLLFIPVGLACAMLSPLAGLLTASALSLAAGLFWRSNPEQITFLLFALSMLSAWGMLALVWSIYHSVYQVGDWIWNYYQRALQLLKDAGDARLELNQALDELLHTNRQLALANEKQLSFRIMAEEAQKTKAAFVAKVSHEFRTPLNMIIGLVNLMVDTPTIYGRQIPKAMLDDLVIIQRNCEHLTGMINDVLALSQAESGQLVLHREYINLEEIITQALDVVQPLMKKKQLEAVSTLPEALPLVYCDRTRIRQVLLNLVSNAARFTEEGGIYIHVEDQPETLLISVRDTGPGIAPDDLERIFDPFCQGSPNQTWRDRGGTGLGLTISRQFIELHGGKIWVESKPGSGATFFFSLPKDQPVAPLVPSRRWISERWNWIARENQSRFSSELFKHPRIALYDPHTVLVDFLQTYQELLEFSHTQTLPDLLQDVKDAPANLILINGGNLEEVEFALEEIRQTVRDTPLVGCVVPPNVWKDQSPSVVKILVKPITKKDLAVALDNLDRPLQRILLVDNDEEITGLYSRYILTTPGWEQCDVQIAASGREALEKMRSSPPDLTLLDISMPDMDGFAVLKEKDSDPAIRDIPVMIVSATDLNVVPLRCQMIVSTMANGLRPAKLVECALELSDLLLRPELSPDQARG